jgi:two-component system phosphate regulon sensor histidine kinase PhoR
MLSRTDDREKRQTLVNDLERLSTKMGNMIDDLLTLARLDNTDHLSLIVLDFEALITEICEPLCPQIEAKNLTLKLNIPKIEVQMRADRSDLSRALANLIQNAVHYTPNGGQVSVEAELQAEQVVIRIQDTGIGIPEADLPNIFKRFFRAPNASASDPEGSGLGLTIVKKVVDRHGGMVECTSTLGEGTCFTVTFPTTR